MEQLFPPNSQDRWSSLLERNSFLLQWDPRLVGGAGWTTGQHQCWLLCSKGSWNLRSLGHQSGKHLPAGVLSSIYCCHQSHWNERDLLFLAGGQMVTAVILWGGVEEFKKPASFVNPFHANPISLHISNLAIKRGLIKQNAMWFIEIPYNSSICL